MKIKASANDFSRLETLEGFDTSAVDELPTWYYDFRRFDLPLSAAELETEFGSQIKLFDVQSTDPGGARQTNAETGSGVNEAFLACGAGIVAMGEGEAFSLYGLSSDDTVITDGASPVVATGTDIQNGCYCGAVAFTNVNAPTAQSVFWWGAPTWIFIEKFFQAYRLQISINRRYQLVDESLFDVGMLQLPPEFVGASDSKIPPMPFIRAVNDNIAAKGLNRFFLAPNVNIADVSGTEESALVPPPLVPCTYGHPKIRGIADRIYCMSAPLLFVPGMRFDVNFVNVEDVSVYQALTNSVTMSCVRAVEGLTGEIAGNVEVFGDNAATVCTIPGGSVSLGMVFKGVSLQPSACVEYLMSNLAPGSMYEAMYREIVGGLGLAHVLQGPKVTDSLVNQLSGWLKRK